MRPSAFIDFRASAGPGSEVRAAFGAPREVLVAKVPTQVAEVLDRAHALAAAGAWCVGYARYEAAAAFDSAFEVATLAAAGSAFDTALDGESETGTPPLAWFAVYDAALPIDARPEGAADSCGHPARPGYEPMHWHSLLERPAFEERIARIHEAIADGEVYQVNLTAPVTSAFKGDANALFEALHAAQPDCYAACIDTGAEQVLSVSPELFFHWQRGVLTSRPMKGTAPRGATEVEDTANAAALAASAKERAENLMIVDLIRNDMSRIAEPHSVAVPRLFETSAWPTLWQMTSDVTCRTRPGTTLSDVFGAMFPCGSITGAPKVRAMHWIHELEDEPRGVYCGAIGVLQPGGTATFSVAIRTVCIDGEMARCGIGSGITWDATAANEWAEWRNKRGFLQRSARPFELLETLRLEDGRYPELHAHLARAAKAAAHFGFEWDEARVRDALIATAMKPGASLRRVRMLCGRGGGFTVQDFELDETARRAASVRRARLAVTAFEEAFSEFVRFKTTRRSHYDAFAPADGAIFDTLLWNERREVTEFTRGNVAVLFDGQWCTPPLHCGLLAGIGRARLLQDGVLIERVISVDDLKEAQGLAFVNALRGWLPLTLEKAPV